MSHWTVLAEDKQTPGLVAFQERKVAVDSIAVLDEMCIGVPEDIDHEADVMPGRSTIRRERLIAAAWDLSPAR